MKKIFILPIVAAFLALACCSTQPRKLTGYVNPLLGTATLHDSVDLGYTPTWRTWGAEVFPGASLPNAMVQVSPVTAFGSGAGYQYEDSLIYAFSHTNKGHWNLNHVPIVAFTGTVTPEDYASPFSHGNEEAAPGYYRVFLERGGIDAEVTSTLRTAFHRYTFTRGGEQKVLVDLQKANDRIREWEIRQEGANTFSGWQQGGDRVHFWAEVNRDIAGVSKLTGEGGRELSVVDFAAGGGKGPLELRVGFSFVSVGNARANLEAEVSGKTFEQVRREADDTWEALLGKIRVKGGTERQKGIFYSALYRSMLWPALRSDVNGDFAGERHGEPGPDGRPVIERVTENKGFRLYTDPSFWDDYRNKLVLLGMLAPDVTVDVINSITYRGGQRGFMPTFFHGDHASVFVAGTYLRGLTEGYDIERAYELLMKNATVEGSRRGGRPYLNEYIERGWISEEVQDPPFVVADERKAAVTKTQEYAYDDYATAILAKALGRTADHDMLMARTGNYKNLFNPANGFMQGRFEDGSWLTPFDPYFPYYAYMYREANGWQSIFYAPHDPEGMIALYPNRAAAEAKLDSLFSEPWRGIQAHNMSVFIGQYCHGNQPDHGFPYMYYWLGKQEKSQKILNHILENFYDMGPHRLAYAGMDDAGEMSAWYVFNAMGLYTFSPADPEYLITVPLFDRVEFDLPEGTFTIRREGSGPKITSITYDGAPLDGYIVSHDALKRGGELVVTAGPAGRPELFAAEAFEATVDGRATSLYTLTNDSGTAVQITNYGARIVDLWVESADGTFKDVVMGFENIDAYLNASDRNTGPVVGRYGNRIARGRFTLDGREYTLPVNNGENHLHGGPQGFAEKVWTVDDVKPRSVTMSYLSPDGEAGYPGNLKITVRYTLTDDNALKLDYTATTDAPTIVNPTSHSYFNLHGTTARPTGSHVMQIFASSFTPTDAGLIPTGEIASVEGTPLDFRTPTPIAERIDADFEPLRFAGGYDQNWVLDKKGEGDFVRAARVWEPSTGIVMEVSTDQPGIQFYSGNFMKGDQTGKRGDVNHYRGGIALETQNFPDAPNHSNFPSAVLRPGETYTQSCIYKFSVKK